MKKALSKHDVNEIIGLYDAGYKQSEISEKTGFSKMTISRYIKAHRGERTCHACGESLPFKARFCFMCGAEILSDEELLAKRVAKLRNVFNLLPEHTRDETIRTINDVLLFLEEVKSNDG